jgi:hypothetical protein
MIKHDNAVLENKRYDKCSQCHKIIVYDTEAIDRQGNLIPLDIERKRHHYNGAQQIVHEERIIKEIQDDIEMANKFELRFELRLAIPEEKPISLQMSHASCDCRYTATKIEKIKDLKNVNST